MALTSALADAILGNKPRAFLSDTIHHVLFNVLKDDTESDNCEVTDHVIENGSSIQDHVWQKPKEMSLKIVIMDHIISVDDPIEMAVSGVTQHEFIASVDDRMDMLQYWVDNKRVLTYYGHTNDLEDVVIQSMSRIHDNEVGDSLKLEISLKQVTFAESSTVDITIAGASASGTSTKAGTPAQRSSIANNGLFKGL